MTKKYIVLLIVGISVIITGCTNAPTVQVVEETPIVVEVEEIAAVERRSIDPLAEEIVKEITADKYTGRLVGTEGNQLTAEYLADQFEANGLTPMNDEGYLQKYTQEVGNPEEQEPQVSILMEDGSVLDLVLGTDYVCSIISEDLDLDIPIVVEPEEDAELPGKCVVIFERGVKSRILCDVLITVDDTFRFTPSIEKKDRKITLSITQTVLEQMKLGGAKRIIIRATSAHHMEEVCNVVGMIPGKNSHEKRAIVFTAHFDHCGKQGENIYKGALDNASGVATMIDVARYVKEVVGEDGFDFDLVFAAVNAEEFWDFSESNCRGSRYLAGELSDQYSQIYNINFDCVGGKGSGGISLGCLDDLSTPLAHALKDSFTCSEIEWNDDVYTDFADHGSFRERGFAAMTVGQIGCIQHVHLPTDTYEKIDYQETDAIAHAVTDIIIQEGEDLFMELARKEVNMRGPDNIQWCQKSEEELIRRLNGRILAFDEAYSFIYDGIRTTGTGYHPFVDLSEALHYYPDVVIPEKVSDFFISKIDINNRNQMGRIYWSTGDNYNSEQLDQIIKIPVLKEDIIDIQIEYYNNDRDEYLCFSLYPSDMKGTLNVYPVEGMHDIYLLKSDWRESAEYEGIIYKIQGWTAEVKTYHKRYDESSDIFLPDWNTMQKPEDEFLNLIEAIQIDEIADVLIQNITAQ